MIDFSALAAGATVAAEADFPSAAATRRRAADPAFVQLVTDATKDHKRRELPGRFSTKPFEGRKGANELSTVANELHRAARQVGIKIAVRRFDVEDASARLTFKVAK
ncbi:hypothetical protein SAMN05661080_02486 [Modestobacter sp. DSM 44400]|uniref:hypothetical protein n=1 Tax=Modestobacter sp. DSM 44400 TaxID=1550230 RepID=UPI000896DD00|nr:hypothetical protein [Modestobacter sp. DSM 44400]SDY15356.1 hypothetical protein SAMN05661080_02486 [Modestobacter sp. DSM 44400]